jgi:hypothetical protein
MVNGKKVKAHGGGSNWEGNEISTNENELKVKLESKYFKARLGKIGIMVRANKLHILNFFLIQVLFVHN